MTLALSIPEKSDLSLPLMVKLCVFLVFLIP